MDTTIEKIIRDTNFTTTMGDKSFSKEDKERLHDCVTGKSNIHELLCLSIARHTKQELR
jgi:hypothetical protein